MKNQKGFIVPLLIAIIAVLVIGGGVYVYSQQNQQQAINAGIRTISNDNPLLATSENTNQAVSNLDTLPQSQSNLLTENDILKATYQISANFGGEKAPLANVVFGQFYCHDCMSKGVVYLNKNGIISTQMGKSLEAFWLYKYDYVDSNHTKANVYIAGNFGSSGSDERIFTVTKIDGKVTTKEITNYIPSKNNVSYSVSGNTLSLVNNGKITQTLTLSKEGVGALNFLPSNNVSPFIIDKDLNFDGRNDVGVLETTGYGGLNYFYDFYLLNSSNNALEKNQVLTQFVLTSINPTKKQITSTYKSGPGYITDTYQWNGSTFVKISPVDTSNVTIQGTPKQCGPKVTSITENARVSFPISISGTINRYDKFKDDSCSWSIFEGQIGSAQLYYNYNNQGWKTVGLAAPVRITDTALDLFAFSTTLNFNNGGIGLPYGTPMKIVFKDEDASGLGSRNKLEFSIILGGSN
ncbi:MAG: hypothetical protein WCO16_03910 [bacterium]